MPLLRKKPFIKNTQPEKLRDKDEVFYCELTGEVFTQYEEFCERIFLCNSLVWSCALTDKKELTYCEALDSEAEANVMLKTFPNELSVPALYLASIAQKSSFNQLIEDVYLFMKDRYFVGESVELCLEDNTWYESVVLKVYDPKLQCIDKSSCYKSAKDKFFPPAANYNYEVERFSSYDIMDVFTADASHIRRKRDVFTREKLRLFLKQYAVLDARSVWVIQGPVLQNHGIQRVKFHDIFVGSPPNFLSSPKKQYKSPTKQSSINSPLSKSITKKSKSIVKKTRQENIEKYFVKEDNNIKRSSIHGSPTAKKSPRKCCDPEPLYSPKQIAKKVKEKYMEAGRRKDLMKQQGRMGLKGEKLKEEKKRRALQEKIRKNEAKLKEKEKRKEEARFIKEWNRQREDLECEELKDLPAPHMIDCRVPHEYFGEFTMILEFLYAFRKVLNVKQAFPGGVTFDLLERALTEKEVAGPLSDVIQMLLLALFKFQVQEDDEVLSNRVPQSVDLEDEGDMTASEAVQLATLAASWSKRYLGMPLRDVTLNSFTVTEVLRLHLLSSGGRAGETSAKWRYQQRGGYRNSDDPGLQLRIKQPHILRALNQSHICEMSLEEKITVLSCLVNQILTYASLRDKIEIRGEELRQIKSELRSFQVAEVKREKEAAAKRIKLKKEARLKLMKGESSTPEKNDDPEATDVSEVEKQKLERELNRKKIEVQKKASKMLPIAMGHQLLPLGTDRAHRRYWMFLSLPGLFVEQDPCHAGPCLSKPTPYNALAQGDTLAYVRRLFEEEWHTGSDKENDGSEIDMSRPLTSQNKKMLSEKNASVNQMSANLPNIKMPQMPFTEDAEKTQTEVWRCTASPNCTVHKASKIVWSFFSQETDVTMLAESLNQRGIRENELRRIIVREELRIKESIGQCPVHKLNPAKFTEHLEQRKSTRLLANYKPEDTNLNFPLGTPITSILEQTLREFILELEEKINSGCLGSLKVKNREAWREALENNGYDKQCDKLVWGPAKHGDTKEDDNDVYDKYRHGGASKDVPFSENFETNSVVSYDSFDLDLQDKEEGSKSKNIPLQESEDDCRRSITPDSELNYHDPGNMLDMCTSDYSAVFINPAVSSLASAILQLAQSVELRYLKKPLEHEDSSPGYTKQKMTQLKLWELSLMASTSFPQLFLHLTTLDRSIHWSRSALNAQCCLCRRRGDADKMLLCDGCNKGHHLYCLKPKLTQVPLGDWYCRNCQPGVKEKSEPVARKRRCWSEDSDDELTTSRQKEVKLDHNHECEICGLGEDLVLCSSCPLAYHTVCLLPPLKNPPRGHWVCPECQDTKLKGVRKLREVKAMKDAAAHHLDSPSIRQRRGCTTATIAKIARFAKRLRSHSWDEDENEESSPSRRSSRRSNGMTEDLPLNNAVLQDLLTEIMHHKDAWPFMRPVRKAEVPDYHLIIKRPMDFGTMKYKLNMIEYMNNNEFIADALLVFENCQMYNQVDADEYKCGLRLCRYFKKRCKDLGLEIREEDLKSTPKRPRLI